MEVGLAVFTCAVSPSVPPFHPAVTPPYTHAERLLRKTSFELLDPTVPEFSRYIFQL